MISRKLASVIGLALSLMAGAGAAGAQQRSPELGAADPRLARPLSLDVDGVPLRQVIHHLGQKAGVRLSVTGSIGDERLLAMAPPTPVSSSMAAIAQLYRATWRRSGDPSRPAYHLSLPNAAIREEQELRTQSMRAVFERLFTQLSAEQQGGRRRTSPLRLALARVASTLSPALWDRLINARYLTLPLKELPVPQRTQIFALLRPAIEQGREDALENARLFPEFAMQAQDAMQEVSPESLGLNLEVVTDGSPQVLMGIRLPWRMTVQTSIAGRSEDIEGVGALLYREYRVRPFPANHTDGVVAPRGSNGNAVPAGPSRGTGSTPAAEPIPAGWADRLRYLSRRFGRAIYSDYYPGHDRRGAVLPSPSEAGDLPLLLDVLAGRPGDVPSRFWWTRGESILIRNRRWLWLSQTVLPARLTDRLAKATQTKRPLDHEDLRNLATLTLPQVQSLFGASRGPFGPDLWQAAIILPMRLSLQSQRRLLNGKLTWETLSAPERSLVGSLLLSAEGSPPQYSAAVRAHPNSNRWVLNLSAQWGQHSAAATVNIPLPGEIREAQILGSHERKRPVPAPRTAVETKLR